MFCATALLHVFAATSLGAGNGLYKGSVVGDAGKDLRVKVKDGRVTKFLANVDANCGFADLPVSVVYPPVGARPDASIKIRGNNPSGRPSSATRRSPTTSARSPAGSRART